MLLRTAKNSVCNSLCKLGRNPLIITEKFLTSMHKLKLFGNTNSFQQTNMISQDNKHYFRVSATCVLEFQGSNYQPTDKLTSLFKCCVGFPLPCKQVPKWPKKLRHGVLDQIPFRLIIR
jgi:hypothetical protein